jgi:hypothetical protein
MFNKRNYRFEIVYLSGPNPQYEYEKGYNYIFYDHHGKGLGTSFPNSFLDENAYIYFDKNSKDFSAIADPIFPLKQTIDRGLISKHWVLPFDLLEAGLFRILIIDERFAEMAKENVKAHHIKPYGFSNPHDSPEHFTFGDLAWASNISIATHWKLNNGEVRALKSDINYKENDYIFLTHFDSNKVKFTANFYAYNNKGANEKRDPFKILQDLNDNEIPFDIVIIHRKYLHEDWIGEKSEDFIKRLRKQIPYVVITSGGTSQALAFDRVKFIAFDDMKSFFGNNSIAKLGLVQFLLGLKIRI